MSRFRFPHDAFALTAALSDGLSEHIHDDLSDKPTFDVSRFRALMTDRDVALEDAIKSGAAATVVVAASNSTSNGQAGADVVCSGSGDQVAINNAIILANGAHNGGKVLLLEGTYSISAPIVMLSNVDLCGVGWGTQIQNQAGAAVSMLTAAHGVLSIQIHDLLIDGNKAQWASGTGRGIDLGDAVNGGPAFVTIYNCLVQNTHDEGLYVRGATQNIHDNQFNSTGGTSILLDGLGNDSTGNILVVRNLCYQPGVNGIKVMADATTSQILQNVVRVAQQHGILLDFCGSVVCDYNFVEGSSDLTSNTYDQIHANSQCTSGSITNNFCLQANKLQARYGIVTDAGSSGLCTMNKLSYGGGSGLSGTLLNNGGWTTTAGNV